MKLALGTGKNEKLLRFDTHQLIKYVAGTRSNDGGYCFYRLNESSAPDTFYTVYVLTALNRPVPEPDQTIDFLLQRQGSNGSFKSVYIADYVIGALYLLGVQPLFDPSEFLLHQLRSTLSIVAKPYYELSNSFLESLGRLVAILGRQQIEPKQAVKTEVIAAIHPYKRPDGGFGAVHSSIYSTYYALKALSFSQSDCLNGVAQWIRLCEWQTGGFSATPTTTANYLDEIYEGLAILRAVNERPRYPQEIARFIGKLQNANGGFRRAAASGISSLENAFYAFKAITELIRWQR